MQRVYDPEKEKECELGNFGYCEVLLVDSLNKKVLQSVNINSIQGTMSMNCFWSEKHCSRT